MCLLYVLLRLGAGCLIESFAIFKLFPQKLMDFFYLDPLTFVIQGTLTAQLSCGQPKNGNNGTNLYNTCHKVELSRKRKFESHFHPILILQDLLFFSISPLKEAPPVLWTPRKDFVKQQYGNLVSILKLVGVTPNKRYVRYSEMAILT